MENIWAFLLQTLTVSIVAGLILFLKWLFQDKLSPRWQYGVWIVLMLRIFFPAQMDKALFINLPIWIETIKSIVERNLQSTYTNAFETISMHRVVPTITKSPESITDWLFVTYVGGIIVMLLWYLVSYIRLRLLLHKGEPISYEQQQIIGDVCKKYNLTACEVVSIQGLPSAFICGIINPVLALPADVLVDEKIILHELLHLQYKDALRNAGWCFLRAFHWCNPFLQMVFRRIGNDMESLCDQRVLERLEGEERRAYGNILLEMANSQYARAPGTTSISNGGKNISRRIAAIVRFKKYPKGMALVSVCIVMVMAVPVMAGTELIYSQNDCEPKRLYELDKAMAMARLNRCTTVAGALDTYAKGLLLENGVYIATVTPENEHATLYEKMKLANIEDGWAAYHLDSGDELEYAYYNAEYGYTIYNLEQVKDSGYSAVLVFRTKGFPADEGYKMRDEQGNIYHQGIVYVPVTVQELPSGYIVWESGEREIIVDGCDLYGNIEPEYEPALREWCADGKSGMAKVKVITSATVENKITTNIFDKEFDTSLKINADTGYMKAITYLFYDANTKQMETLPERSVAMQLIEVDKKENLANYSLEETISGDVYFVKDATGILSAGSGLQWNDINGNTQIEGRNIFDEEWDGKLFSGGGEGYYTVFEPLVLPEAYLVGIYWDGHLVEKFLIEEEGLHDDLLRETE